MERKAMTRAEREVQRDLISAYKRSGVVGSIVVTTLVVLFFYANQVWSTGFFTPSFGPLESAAF